MARRVSPGTIPTVVKVGARIGGEPFEVSFDGNVAANPDAALPTFLLAAMSRGQPLELNDVVSESVLRAAAEVQRVISMWWPTIYTPVEIAARTRSDGGDRRRPGAASFFSGGIDSFYTALTMSDEITHLVFVHGFDIALRDENLRARAATAAREAASELGIELLQVETNARSVLDINWEHGHGTVMAAIGMLVEPQVGTVLIPASYTYCDLFPWGSHPVLDPLWSSERQRVIHQGAGVTRFEKSREIATSDVALRYLRVCWENPDGEFNCGRCAKCLRTMTALQLHGRLRDCPTLPNDINTGALARYHPVSSGEVAFVSENLAAARAQGDQVLVSALSRSLAPGRVRRTVERVTTPLRHRAGADRRRYRRPRS